MTEYLITLIISKTIETEITNNEKSGMSERDLVSRKVKVEIRVIRNTIRRIKEPKRLKWTCANSLG
jgi:hypothetical protein